MLCREEAWLPFGIIRTSVVAKVKGGLPCVFRKLFRSWLCGEPARLGTEGLVVKLSDGEPVVIVFVEMI